MCIMYTIIIIINNCSLYCEIIFCSVLHLHFYHQYIWVWWVMIIYNLLVLCLWIEIKIDLIFTWYNVCWLESNILISILSLKLSKINTSYIICQYFSLFIYRLVLIVVIIIFLQLNCIISQDASKKMTIPNIIIYYPVFSTSDISSSITCECYYKLRTS